jgi:hypothetical protein
MSTATATATPTRGRILTAEERAARSAKALARYYALKNNKEFDNDLTKPVRFSEPPAGLHPVERRRLEDERTCLQRELANTQRGIKHLDDLLAA